MKTTTTLVLLLLFASSLFAQEESIEIKTKKRNYGTSHYFNVDLGINNWVTPNGSPDKDNALYSVKPFGSWYIALKGSNLTHVTGRAYIDWGVGVSWFNLKFQDPKVRILKDDNGIEFVQDQDVNSALKSKLTATYINVHFVPVFNLSEHRYRKKELLEGGNSGFRIGAGIYTGYRLDSYTKTVHLEEGKKKKNRNKDAYYINNWRYGARLLVGFRDVNVFLDYDINPFFYENKGPELNAFTFGVSF